MSNLFKSTIFVAAVLLFIGLNAGYSQSRYSENTLKLDEGMLHPTAKIEDAAWIAGSWSGDAFGGTFEEVWSTPSGGTMMGMFKLVKDDKIGFYEILTISEKSNSLVLKLKHFNANLTGWEEKDDYLSFPLVKISEKEVNFEGMTFRKKDLDTIEVFLAMKHDDGTISEVEFVYNRAK